jgi:predicted ArsR family transcriptional regulator
MSLDKDLSKVPRPTESPVVTDPRTLRALTHPVRIALLEALSLEGARTATQVGEIIGESPTTCSFHLRQLAKYGFVEEAEGGTGRRRPWRLKQLGMRYTDVHEDPETARAGRALSRVMHSRYFARAEQALQERQALPAEWRAVTGVNQMRFYLTPDELSQLDKDLLELMMERFGDRRAHQPPGTERVEILTMAYRTP